MGEKLGRLADRSGKNVGLLQTGKKIFQQVAADHIGITAAGVAFYFLFALFPVIVAFISIYGLVFDPIQVGEQMSKITEILPAEAHRLLSDRLKAVAMTSSTTLGYGVALSILVSLWSANTGTKALFEGINIAYNEQNKRSFIQENAITLLFTLGAMVVGILCMLLIVGFPALEEKLSLPEIINTVINWGRWLLLAFLILIAITLIYRYAPFSDKVDTGWISWGAVVALLLWLLGSWGFSFYVKNFGNYSEGYGSAAAVVILMLWLNLTSFSILLGAEINSVLDSRTARYASKQERIGTAGTHASNAPDSDTTTQLDN